MYNNDFTYEEIDKINEYNSFLAFFNVEYEKEDELNIKLNKAAATTEFEILKLSKSRKIALFKDNKKVFYTSLQGCNCKEYEKHNCCVHMFKLAHLLKIIDVETGVLLYPQTDFEEIPYEEIETSSSPRHYTPPSTIGIGKRCKNCKAVIDYDKKVCPSCGKNPDNTNNNKTKVDEQLPFGCLISIIISFFIIIMISIIT